MRTSDLTLNHLPEFGGSQLLSAPRLVRRGREEEMFSKYVKIVLHQALPAIWESLKS